MLHHYYNILEADKFEKWYSDLYIGKHPTPERNSYLIIYHFFCNIYAQYLPEGIKEEMNKKREP